MRYLIIHSRYSRPGGEEQVVAFQCDLLLKAGHQVEVYERDYNEMKGWKFGKISTFFSSLYNRRSVGDVRRLIRTFSPDVAIVHNLFPVISPAILSVLRGAGVRVLMSVHNYRLFCPTGLFYRRGEVCERCAHGCLREFNCFVHRCEGSFFGSFGYFFRSWWARIFRSYLGNVDLFLAISPFQRDKLVQYGVPSDRVCLLPNSVSLLGFGSAVADFSGGYVGFVGRLSSEKGVDLLFSVARSLPEVRFRVAGDLASNYSLGVAPSNVEFVGFLDRASLGDFYRSAGVIINTSGCYEGLPLSLLEAMSLGCVVLAQRFGVMTDLLGGGTYGVLVSYGDVSDFCSSITRVLGDLDFCFRLGRCSRAYVLEHYSSSAYLSLLEGYSRVVD